VCWNLVDDDAEAVKIVHHAIDRGITYIDTASGYKESERRLGLALKDRDRDQLFIATKCAKRSGDEARREVEQSFERLDLEVIDLMQLHAIDQDENPEEALQDDGVLRVIEEYREAGKIRFVGMTGHMNPPVFVDMMQKYEFDTILNALGPVTHVWNDFSEVTVPAARERGMGVIGMKVMAYGLAPPEYRAPFLRYTMGLPIDVAIVGMDTVEQVEENVRAAEAFEPLSPEEEEDVLTKALEIAQSDDRKDLWFLPEHRRAS
jgi:aryl-alcohol dehydrogenase-like predicted oxidoreductase